MLRNWFIDILKVFLIFFPFSEKGIIKEFLRF
jgi:hypothetical protein